MGVYHSWQFHSRAKRVKCAPKITDEQSTPFHQNPATKGRSGCWQHRGVGQGPLFLKLSFILNAEKEVVQKDAGLLFAQPKAQTLSPGSLPIGWPFPASLPHGDKISLLSISAISS